MYHSITFGDGTVTNGVFIGKNTWEDWHLIPSSRPTVVQATASTNFVEIPGREDGPIDMSEYLTNSIIYGARSGSFEFLVDNDHEYWEAIRTKIVSYLHGKRMKMWMEDDPGFYYEGRFSLNAWTPENWNSKVTINYALNPYKYKIVQGADLWLWDPFVFEEDEVIVDNNKQKLKGEDEGWL